MNLITATCCRCLLLVLPHLLYPVLALLRFPFVPLTSHAPRALTPTEYAPDLVIISAGFDAAEGDPIGGCHLTPECYAHMAAQLQLVAPTVALLEGGYNLLSTARGTEAVLRVLLGERPPALPAADRPACADAMGAVAQVGGSTRGPWLSQPARPATQTDHSLLIFFINAGVCASVHVACCLHVAHPCFPAALQVMRIQSRYWGCMRGLVQQQFKVLAAAAARQEQLAAMKARRVEALAGGEGGLEDSPPSPLCEAEVDREVEEEEALLGSMHPQRLRAPAALDALEEEAGTPHQGECTLDRELFKAVIKPDATRMRCPGMHGASQ